MFVELGGQVSIAEPVVQVFVLQAEGFWARLTIEVRRKKQLNKNIFIKPVFCLVAFTGYLPD
jgi:uncharacterized membrane protein